MSMSKPEGTLKHWVPIFVAGIIVILGMVFFSPSNSQAVWNGSSEAAYHVGYDYEDLAVGTSTAIGVTVSKIDTTYPESTRVYVEADVDMNIRWDGTGDPSSSSGHNLTAGERWNVTGLVNIQQVKFFSTSAGDGTAAITFERKKFLREGF